MNPVPITVLTWNVNFRDASTLTPIEELSPRPDVVTLQEVTHAQASHYVERLQSLNYHTMYSGSLDADEKRYGNLIATLLPVRQAPTSNISAPWPQLIGHACIEVQDQTVHIVTAHVPNGSRNGWKKIETLEALRQLVLSLRGEPLILTGDFNEPRLEPFQDGRIVTWGQEKEGGRWELWSDWNVYGESGSGERWDSAVRWFFESPEESGIRHTYVETAGAAGMEATHDVRGAGRWFDHIFASKHFDVASCEYHHTFRTQGYSDHSAVQATMLYYRGDS